MALVCISLMASNIKPPLMGLLVICTFSLEKCLFRSFIILIGYVSSYVLERNAFPMRSLWKSSLGRDPWIWHARLFTYPSCMPDSCLSAGFGDGGGAGDAA